MSYVEGPDAKLILLADDDPDIRTLVKGAIEMLGHHVITAVDGAQALSMFEQTFPDLVLLDVMMPHVNGVEVCQKLKHHQHGQFIPVVMLTARDSVQAKVEALDGGADDYITKPFHYQELQARIKAWLRIRELTVRLDEKNKKLEEMQAELIEKERQLLVGQLAGTAAHQLGQPLSAILLNCHLMEHVGPGDDKFMKAFQAIKSDAERMVDMIQRLRAVDAGKKEQYSEHTSILRLGSQKKEQ